MRIQPAVLGFLLSLLALGTWSCGGDSKNSNGSKTQTIGSEGGIVGSAQEAQVLIPAAALSDDKTITVATSSQAGPENALSPVFELSPDGTTFARPAQLAIRLTSEIPAELAATIAVWNEDSEQWSPIPSLVQDGLAVAQLEHFSSYAVTAQGDTEPITAIDNINVTPGTRIQSIHYAWDVWEANSHAVTISGTASPNGTGTWFSGFPDGRLRQGTFQIQNGAFSFTHDIQRDGGDVSLIGVGSFYDIDISCAGCQTAVDAGTSVDAASVDAPPGPDAAPPNTYECSGLPATLPDAFIGNTQANNVIICITETTCRFSNQPSCEQLVFGSEGIVFGRNLATQTRFMFANNGWGNLVVSESAGNLPADTIISFTVTDPLAVTYAGSFSYTGQSWTLLSFGIQ